MRGEAGETCKELETGQAKATYSQNGLHGGLCSRQLPPIHSQGFPSIVANRKKVPIRPDFKSRSPQAEPVQGCLPPAQPLNPWHYSPIQGLTSFGATALQQYDLGPKVETLVLQGLPSVARQSSITPFAQVRKAPLSVIQYRGRSSYRIDKASRCNRTVSSQPAVPASLGRRIGSSVPTVKTFSSWSPQLRGLDYGSNKYGNSFTRKRRHTDETIALPAPKPTEAYTTRASIPPTRASAAQTLLLVLDLNGTLLYRTLGNKTYIPRPGLERFLDYCFENHHILIWSSAQPHNVAGLCEKIFTAAQRELLLGQWGRDTLGLTPQQYKQRVQVYKNLGTVWKDPALQSRHPDFATGGTWGQHNTVLVDDSVIKAAAQPFNHIEVPEFVTTEDVHGREENVLSAVVAMLEEARGWSDVSAYVRSKGDDGKLIKSSLLKDVCSSANLPGSRSPM